MKKPLHISKLLAEWFWKRWSWKSLNLTKVVVCFSQSVEWTKNARAVKICHCSYATSYALRALALLLVFEKFTRAYLFQIAREKSCDYLY